MLLRLTILLALTACLANFDDDVIPAEPEAPIGFGRDAAGGQRRCYASDGETFRACAEDGGREIRFTAVDEIDLGGDVNVASNTTIRGETRRGITLRGGSLVLNSVEDVIIRNLTIFGNPQALILSGSRRVLADHLIIVDASPALVVTCSEDVTLSRSLMEDNRVAVRIEGIIDEERHRCGANSRISVMRNVFLAFDGIPRISGENTDVGFGNNIVLGWRGNNAGAINLVGPVWSATRLSMVGNHYQRLGRQPASMIGDPEGLFTIEEGIDASGIYLHGNTLPSGDEADEDTVRRGGVDFETGFDVVSIQILDDIFDEVGPQQPSADEKALVDAAKTVFNG